MQPVYDPWRRHTDSTNKERSFLLDDDVDELRELALAVVVVCLPSGSTNLRDQ